MMNKKPGRCPLCSISYGMAKKTGAFFSQSKTSSQATAGSLTACCQEITMVHGIPVNYGISLDTEKLLETIH